MKRVAKCVSTATNRLPPSNEITTDQFDFIGCWFIGLIEFNLAVRSERQSTLKLLALVTQHPKQTSDPAIQIVVDFDGGRRLVEQNRCSTAEGLDERVVNWKLLNDSLAQVEFAPMPFGGRSQLRQELFMPVREQIFGGKGGGQNKAG